jgi:hypothetical protein
MYTSDPLTVPTRETHNVPSSSISSDKRSWFTLLRGGLFEYFSTSASIGSLKDAVPYGRSFRLTSLLCKRLRRTLLLEKLSNTHLVCHPPT